MNTYFLLIFFSCLSIILFEFFNYLISPPSMPKINEDNLWTNELHSKADVSVRRFRINVPEKIIKDLKWRLENHRPLVTSMEGSANKYGTNSHFLKEMIDFWLHNYNWTERETYLNRYPQFITNIQGLDIHFIHIKPKEANNKKVLPLLMLHGWPGSVREFYDVIDILNANNNLTVNAKFVFEIVVPSLPGYGFSQAASRPGLDIVQVGIIMKNLMNRLGHQRFYVQGGDMGALALQTLCVLHPESILGFHSNFAPTYTVRSYLKTVSGILFPNLFVKPEHYDRVYPLFEKGLFVFKESGYLHFQSTKPDSLGHAINDSPVGLTSYFLEKFITGSNFTWINNFDSNKMKAKFPYTNLLDNIMYYWITGTATSAFRLYYETFGEAFWTDSMTLLRIPIQVPAIIYRSKYDIYSSDGALSEIYPNLLHLSDYDTGHFPAFENPQLFSSDLKSAIEKFEDYNLQYK